MPVRKLAVALAMLMVSASAWAAPPIDKIRLPPGFRISVWAEVDGARSMAVGDGFVVVGTRGDSVCAVPFDRRTFQAGDTVELTDDLNVPNGVALLDGVLYIAEQDRVIRWGNGRFDPAKPNQQPVKVGPGLPDKSHHGWRYLAAGPDGALYVTIGTPCNVCMPKGLEGTIVRLEPKTGAVTKVASGIRNSVGVAFHPRTREMFFTDNGADMMGDDIPREELNRLTARGQGFGYPWYAGGRTRSKEFAGQQPSAAQFPVAEFTAHSAPLGLAFYTGAMFPPAYRDHAFLAHHGSWNRSTPVGYRLMEIQMDNGGNVTATREFATGWLRKGDAWGRPVDVKMLPDGSMLVSDDHADVIYRITYGK
jgi:glucose/arabinose dehydrogenase